MGIVSFDIGGLTTDLDETRKEVGDHQGILERVVTVQCRMMHYHQIHIVPSKSTTLTVKDCLVSSLSRPDPRDRTRDCVRVGEWVMTDQGPMTRS